MHDVPKELTEEEGIARRDAALTRALTKPHKIQKSDKPGKKVAKKKPTKSDQGLGRSRKNV